MLTIYKASAGSGKTYTLAYQYIKILLAYFEREDSREDLRNIIGDEEGPRYNPDDVEDGAQEKGRWRLYGPKGPRSRHRHILAVTFTHKATEEMKNRIIKELRQIVNTATGDEAERSDYAKKLLELTGCTPEELKETAENALDDLLYDFHFFNVSTIDSFFQQVLRGFAREVAKNEDFALEIDNTMAVTMGVDSMLNSINTDNTPEARTLESFIGDWMSAEYRAGRIGNMFNRNTGIYRKLVKFVESTMSEEFKEYSEDVIRYLKDDPSRFARFHKALTDRYYGIPDQIKALASEALNILGASDKLVQDNINSNLVDFLRKIVGLPTKKGKVVPFDFDKNPWANGYTNYVKAAFNNPIDIFNKPYKDKTSEVPQPLCDTIARTFEAVVNGSAERRWLKAVTSLLSHFGVLVSALDFIMQYRQDNNLILLSDTNELLQKVINDQDAPFIYEKLGNILDYYLIDEFQDTSRLQWDNLRPLVGNSISQGNEGLIIGDEKQSIYRFRNADAELLHHKAQEDIGAENCNIRGDRPGENTNYRSAPAVVRFNNALFEYLGKEVKTDYFKNVVQDIPEKNRSKHGHVRFDGIPASKKEDFGQIALERLISDIRSLRQRGYRNSDIVILVRTREEGNAIVERLLQQNDPEIVVASDESLKLTMCPSVRVILSALRMFAQNRDTSPEEPTVDNDLEMRINEVEFLNSQESDISKAVQDIVNGKRDQLQSLNTVLDYRSSNLFTLTEKIIQDVLSDQMRQRDYSYIMAFQDCVTKFCSQFTSNVRKFLRWWDMNEMSLTVVAAPNADAIRVMTIHKSKGLEFKCVILPFTDIGVKDREELWLKGERLKGLPNLKIDDDDIPPLLRVQGSSALNSPDCPFYNDYLDWRQNQKADMLNVGYVAFTRAENELIGYIKTKPTKSSSSSEKSAKSKSKSKTASETSSDEGGTETESGTTKDVINIGELLIDAFRSVTTASTVSTVKGLEDCGCSQTGVPANGTYGDATGNGGNSGDEDVDKADKGSDELYYCRHRQQRIPLTMPLSPYYSTEVFPDVFDYEQGISDLGLEPKDEEGCSIEAEGGISVADNGDTSAKESSAKESLGITVSSDENEQIGASEPFVIERFEYGEPTVAPALEETDEEREQRLIRDHEKEQEQKEEDARFRSPLERISISEYTPTFPKNVEHYFTVEEEEESYEEEDIASEPGDAVTDDDGLPGGFDRQVWGEILHRAMSYINDKSDTESAIARVYRQFKMDDDAYQYLCRRVWETVEFDHPQVKLWFDRRHYDSVVTERPIYEPTTLATYRPDRIVWYKDGSVDIVDYKFGVQFSEDYNLQMKKYMELIEYMGVPEVRGYIYFPTSRKIKEFHK